MPKEGLSIGDLLSPDGETGTVAAGTQVGPADSGKKTFQASVTGTGLVTATVVVQASHMPTVHGWVDLGTITLARTTQDTDGFTSESSWPYFRGKVTAISGTGAKVRLTVAQE